MVLDVSQENLNQPLEEVLFAKREPNQSEGITIVEQLDEKAQRNLAIIRSLIEPAIALPMVRRCVKLLKS